MSARKKAEIIGTDDIPSIMEMAKLEIHRGVIQPVESALKELEMLKGKISNFQLLALTSEFVPKAPSIIMREKTINSLFKSFEKKMSKDEYEKALYEAGYDAGRSLSDDLLKFLRGIGKLPKNDEVMIRIWALMDTGAGWGEFQTSFNKENKNITVKIKDSFLSRTLKEDKHGNCPFMKGYIIGFLWDSLRERYRWFVEELTQPKDPPLEPVSIEEMSTDSICIFNVMLRDEQLRDAFDQLYKAKYSLLENNFTETVTNIRSALEFAFKEKTGVGKNSQTSLIKIIKTLKNMGVVLSFDEALEVYNQTSDIIHNRRPTNSDECLVMLRKTNEMVSELERLDSSKINKAELRTLFQ